MRAKEIEKDLEKQAEQVEKLEDEGVVQQNILEEDPDEAIDELF